MGVLALAALVLAEVEQGEQLLVASVLVALVALALEELSQTTTRQKQTMVASTRWSAPLVECRCCRLQFRMESQVWGSRSLPFQGSDG